MLATELAHGERGQKSTNIFGSYHTYVTCTSGCRDFDITEIDITESDVTETDITENDITESHITESDIT